MMICLSLVTTLLCKRMPLKCSKEPTLEYLQPPPFYSKGL